jgi:hypothetical protein
MTAVTLHVFQFSCEWFIAESAAHAVALWREEHEEDPDDDEDEPEQLPDDQLFEFTCDGGDTFEEKTCGEWALEYPAGFFAREL